MSKVSRVGVCISILLMTKNYYIEILHVILRSLSCELNQRLLVDKILCLRPLLSKYALLGSLHFLFYKLLAHWILFYSVIGLSEILLITKLDGQICGQNI